MNFNVLVAVFVNQIVIYETYDINGSILNNLPSSRHEIVQGC